MQCGTVGGGGVSGKDTRTDGHDFTRVGRTHHIEPFLFEDQLQQPIIGRGRSDFGLGSTQFQCPPGKGLGRLNDISRLNTRDHLFERHIFQDLSGSDTDDIFTQLTSGGTGHLGSQFFHLLDG